MENPIVAFREQLGVSRPHLARLLNVSYLTLARAETGYQTRLGKRVAEGLVRLGYEGSPEADYSAWRRNPA